jgi:hypothetical protein
MSSPVRHELTEYAAGRGNADRLVQVVAAAYYGEGGRGKWEGLQPIVDVIERAAPGIAALASAESRPGFEVRLAERSFPARYQDDLRRAVEQALASLPVETPPAPPAFTAPPASPRPGFFSRIFGAIQRLFT